MSTMYVPSHKLKGIRPQPYTPPPIAPPPHIAPLPPIAHPQPHLPEFKIFKPWYRYQLLSAKIAATQVVREECAKVNKKINNELRLQSKRLLFKFHGYQDLQNQRVQEMFEMREDGFDILEVMDYPEKRIQQMGEEALNDQNCKRGYEDHVFMRTGLRRIDYNIVDLEEKIERMDRLLAREAVMRSQLEDCLYDFVERANLSLEEKEDWEAQGEATQRTSRFLKVHSQDLEFAIGEAKSLGLEDFQREIEGRKSYGENGYALME